MSSAQSEALAPLLSFEEYRGSRAHCFPSAGSLAWYARMHKSELIDAGALLKHRGAWHVHAARFDAAVMRLAERASKRAAAEIAG